MYGILEFGHLPEGPAMIVRSKSSKTLYGGFFTGTICNFEPAIFSSLVRGGPTDNQKSKNKMTIYVDIHVCSNLPDGSFCVQEAFRTSKRVRRT